MALTKDQIKLFAPSNLKNLTQEEVEQLCELNSEDLQVLAKEYPNHQNTKSYLLAIYDTKNINHVPTSTWYSNIVDTNRISAVKKLVVIGVFGGLTSKNFSHFGSTPTVVNEIVHEAVIPQPISVDDVVGTEKPIEEAIAPIEVEQPKKPTVKQDKKQTKK